MLPPNEIHIHRIDLPVPEAIFAACSAALTPEETARANRYKQPLSRQHFTIGRGALRHLLPANAPISTNPQGKPETPGVAFNVAHSGNLILIALQSEGDIGIDVEQINPATPIHEIARKVFTPNEASQIASVETFFDLWTRKEAIIKADGRGLSLPLDSFTVENPTIIPQPIAPPKTFHLHPIPVPPGYAAHLATTTPRAAIRVFHFPHA